MGLFLRSLLVKIHLRRHIYQRHSKAEAKRKEEREGRKKGGIMKNIERMFSISMKSRKIREDKEMKRNGNEICKKVKKM